MTVLGAEKGGAFVDRVNGSPFVSDEQFGGRSTELFWKDGGGAQRLGAMSVAANSHFQDGASHQQLIQLIGYS